MELSQARRGSGEAFKNCGMQRVNAFLKIWVRIEPDFLGRCMRMASHWILKHLILLSFGVVYMII